jgi:hypothetical protein
MPEAARRANVSATSIRRSLANAGISLVEINAKAKAVDESDLEVFLETRKHVGYTGTGRPRGAKNKIQPTTTA